MQHSPQIPGSYTFAASVAEALLQQFQDYAKLALDNGDVIADLAYEKVLQGLQVAAPQTGATILDKLLLWRGEMLAEVGNARLDVLIVLRKRLVVEALFLDASLRVLSAAPTVATSHHLNELQSLAFDWTLNGERYVDSKFPALHRLRDTILTNSARVLGAMSPVGLDALIERFLAEVAKRIKAEASSVSRQELYDLCHGLRFLRLHDDSPAQLRSAASFLENLFPLKHVAPDKKSRLQQAIADALTSVLVPLVDDSDPGRFGANLDPNLQSQWFATVRLMRMELFRWTSKQAKQAAAGLPVVTALTCLSNDKDFMQEAEPLIDLLHRYLRDKKTASVALMCLVRFISCFLRRRAYEQVWDGGQLAAWATKVTSPVVQAVLRGQLVASEQLELMRQLATVITGHLPELGVRTIILKLLAIDGTQQPWEAPMAGLLSLMSILAEAPARVAGRPPHVDLPPTAAAMEAAAATAAAAAGSGFGGTAWSPSPAACDQLLEVVKHGRTPFEAYDIAHFAPTIAAAVGKLQVQCHQLHGYTRLTNAARLPQEAPPSREQRFSALSVFVATLQLTPFVVPENWAGTGMADDLPGYTIHAEPAVRNAAIAAMHRCLVALPSARDALLGSMAVFSVRLQEEFVELIKDSLHLVLALVLKWHQLSMAERVLAHAAGEPAASPATQGVFNSIARVEGAALGLLCAADVDIRKLAVDVLRATRTLHKALSMPLNLRSSMDSWNSFGIPSARSSIHAGAPAGSSTAVDGIIVPGTTTTTASLSIAQQQSQQQPSIYPPIQPSGTLGFAPDAPPLLNLPLHLRRSGGGPGGSTAHAPSHPFREPASVAVHHARRSTLGSNMSTSIPPPAAPTSNADIPFASVPSTPSSFGDGFDSGMRYLADIIDSLGDTLAREVYWDFGSWSDLWREWRPVPADASFVDCLSRGRGGASSGSSSSIIGGGGGGGTISSVGDVDCVRWARLLCELTSKTWRFCEQTAWTAHTEITSKLQALVSLDSTGRPVIPMEGLRGVLARNYALLAAAAPLMDASSVGERGVTSRDLIRMLVSSARVSTVDAAPILALGCVDPSCHALVATETMALAEEYAGGSFGSRSGGTSRGGRGGHRREEARLIHAHVLRMVASKLVPGSLANNSVLRERLVDFVAESARHISLTVDVSPELQQLRYCLCGVARSCANQLAEPQPQMFPPMLRKQLFDKFSLYCEEGQTPGLFRSELRRHIAAAKAAMKGRDADLLRHLETDIVDASEMLEHAAYLGMAAMLSGPVFDGDACDPGGRVFTWIERMLTPRDASGAPLPAHARLASPNSAPANGGSTAWGPPKEHAAHVALRNLLHSNPELAPLYVDRAYVPSRDIASSFFLVLAEVHAMQSLPLEQHVVVALVLHKIVDPSPAVRDAARGMLSALARRHWNILSADPARRSTMGLPPIGSGGPSTSVSSGGGGGGGAATVKSAGVSGEGEQTSSNAASEEGIDGAVVVGSLAESHQAYQQYISANLARDHAELAHSVVQEVLTRHQHGAVTAASADVLLCLPPWLEYAAFYRGWEGHWSADVLKAMYISTAVIQHGSRRAYPVQKLWMTVAANRRNIVPVVDFLLKQGVADSTVAASKAGRGQGPAEPAAAVAASASIGKQIALYLSRVAPRHVIDLLAQEATMQMSEPDDSRRPGSAAGQSPPNRYPAGAAAGGLSPGGGDLRSIKEFHHKASVAPQQAPLPLQQPLAAHAAAAVAAATAASSKPLTPTSIAQAIKRSTVDLIIKTGVAVADTVAVAGAAAVGVGTIAAQGLTSPNNTPRDLLHTSYDTSGVQDLARRSNNYYASNPGYPYAHESALSQSSRPSTDWFTAHSTASTVSTPPPASQRLQKQQNQNQQQQQCSYASASPPPLKSPSPPRKRDALTRPELALCLLSEIACERDEELRSHLPALLHVAVLHVDSSNPTVRMEACQLLQYLLYSLAYKQLESQIAAGVTSGGDVAAEFARVSGVIGYLQSLGGEALWEWELPTLTQPWVASAGYVAAFVQLVANCFYFDSSLRERWSAEALKWACCAASRHAASRSHQVFCALGPSLSSAAATALLAALAKCLHNATAASLDTAVELLCTLRVLLDNTPTSKIVLYPHVFAACIALLNSSVVRIGELALALLIQLLDDMDLFSPVIQQAVLSVLPLDFWDDGAVSASAGEFSSSATSLGPLGHNNNNSNSDNPTAGASIGMERRPGADENRPTSSSASSTTRPSSSQSHGGRRRSSTGLTGAARVHWPLGEALLGAVADVDPDAAGGPWLVLQQLLVKGLLQEETEALVLGGMAAIARQVTSASAKGGLNARYTDRKYGNEKQGSTIRDATNLCSTMPMAITRHQLGLCDTEGSVCSGVCALAMADGGIEAIIGSVEVGLAISLAAALPWICVHIDGGGGNGGGELAGPCFAFLRDMADAMHAIGWIEIAAMLAVLSEGAPPAPPGAGYRAWLPDLISAMCSAFFPAYSRLVVQRLMEAVQKAPMCYQEAALVALRCIFQVPGLDIGSPSWFADASHLVEMLGGEVGGPLGPHVLALLEAMAAFRDEVRGAPQWGEPVQLEWRLCIDDLGEGNKVCSEALRRVVEACPGVEGLARAAGVASPGSGAAAGYVGVGSRDVAGGLGVLGEDGGGLGEQLLPFLLPGDMSWS